MGLEEHQNEAPGDEPQENTADYEEIRSSNQGEEKKPIQGNYEKEAGAQDISEQAGEAVPSDCSLKFFCTDITYLPFSQGFVYLSVAKDIASGEVVAWNASLYLGMSLVVETVRSMPQNLCQDAMIHSDQGFHYTNPSYIRIVEETGMVLSMSGKGSCVDNAPVESFFGHMKDELEYRSCRSFEEVNLKIGEYMRYYNCERKQWTRKKMAPVEYRNHLLAQLEGRG